MLMPPPSPARDETQDDSGFHSGGMSSSTSTEHDQMQGGKTKKKSIMKSSKGTKRSESQPGRMNRCESIDLKEKQKGSSDHQFRTRSKLISEQTAHYGGHYPHMAPHAIYAVHPQVGFDQSPPHESDWVIQVHPAAPILVGHGQLPPGPVGKKGNSSTVDFISIFLSSFIFFPIIHHLQVGKSYLSKLVSLPFLGGSSRQQQQQTPNVYGKSNNLPPHSEEHGRAFYL